MTETDLTLRLCVESPLTPIQAFAGWTRPDLLKQWFCPRPWSVSDCEIDLRPGGIFATVMRSPEGEDLPKGDGCFLLVEPPHRLVWTNLMGADFRPAPPFNGEGCNGFGFTCALRFDPLPGGGCLYQAEVTHADAAGKQAHEAMGFELGWRAALAQLEELAARGII